MAKPIPSTQAIQQEALKILEHEMESIRYPSSAPYSLVQVVLKDGTTHELMIRLRPHDLYEMGEEMKKHGMLVMNNDESAVLVMAADVKQITVTKVTKEQS